MLLKLMDKLGRKKIVLDRGPSHPKFNEAKPWMNRYYILFRHRPRWFPFNILIHEMLADDHGDGVHTHPLSLCNNNFKRWLLGNNKIRKILETSWLYWF